MISSLIPPKYMAVPFKISGILKNSIFQPIQDPTLSTKMISSKLNHAATLVKNLKRLATSIYRGVAIIVAANLKDIQLIQQDFQVHFF